MARAVGLIEDDRRSGTAMPFPVQMTVATTDGRDHVGVPLLQRGAVAVAVPQHRRLDAARSSTRTTPLLHGLSDDARLVVSEPLGDLHGAWREVPESSCTRVHGRDESWDAFAPLAP